MSATLRQQALSATAWGGVETFVRYGLQFGLAILLARFVSPEDFGLWTLLALCSGLAGAIAEGGFGAALVRAPHISQTDISTVFYVQLAGGFGAAAALILISGPIARVYDKAIIEPLLWTMAANVAIGCSVCVHISLTTRVLDFRTQLAIGTASSAISAAAAAVAALAGAGVWSFAAQAMIGTIVTVVGYWYMHSWRPSMHFDLEALARLFRFGGFMLASGLLNVLESRLAPSIVARLYTLADAGQYSRASSTQEMPNGALSAVLTKVAFPVFARVQGDRDLLRAALRRGVIYATAINAPVMFGLAATAQPLVRLLFGDVWLPSVPVLQILCFAGLFWPFHLLNLSMLMALGRSDLFFRLEVIKKFVTLAALTAAAPLGLIALAWSQVAVAVIFFVINTYYSQRMLRYGPWEQLRDGAPWMCAAMLMSLIVAGAAPFMSAAPALALAVLVPAGVTLYGLFCCFWDRGLLISLFQLLFRRGMVGLESR